MLLLVSVLMSKGTQPKVTLLFIRYTSDKKACGQTDLGSLPLSHQFPLYLTGTDIFLKRRASKWSGAEVGYLSKTMNSTKMITYIIAKTVLLAFNSQRGESIKR